MLLCQETACGSFKWVQSNTSNKRYVARTQGGTRFRAYLCLFLDKPEEKVVTHGYLKDLHKWESVNFMEPTKENSADDMAELSRYA